jgi:hypothetical protein
LYTDQILELIDISGSLNDETKSISEYWTDGPNSELPPGHWCLFAQYISRRDQHTVDEDVKLFFVLTNALEDAAIACWKLKREFDSIRPVSAVPYLMGGKTIYAWAGPGMGSGHIDGLNWLPYQPQYFATPPFPEYPSGHSAFSSAAAVILQHWTGANEFGASATILKGSSRIEPGITPQQPVTLHWATFSEAAEQAGMSRRYGGIHFKNGDLAGRLLGRLVAERTWKKASAQFSGASEGPVRHTARAK